MGEGLYNWSNSKHHQFVDGHEQLHSSVGLLPVEFRGNPLNKRLGGPQKRTGPCGEQEELWA